MTVLDLISQKLNRRGQSQWGEMMEYFDKKNKSKNITETGFFLARRKINPEAIRVLCNNFFC